MYFCFAKPFRPMKKRMMLTLLNKFALAMPYLNGERILCKPILFADLKSWRLRFVSVLKKYK
jgi:hypothetical protein